MKEAEVLAALRRHYMPIRGNGDEWGFLPHVRDRAGQQAKRTADLICFGLWPSRGLPILGHEIKCSRADWLNELRNPQKADAFHEHVDGWYLVVTGAGILQNGELPDGWGLMIVAPPKRKGAMPKIEVMAPATLKPRESRPATVDRSFAAAMLKVPCRTLNATPEEVHDAEEKGREAARVSYERSLELKDEQIRRLRRVIEGFEQASGVAMQTWHGTEQAATVGAALRLVLAGNADTARIVRDLNRLADRADEIAKQARHLAQNEPPTV